MQLKKATPRQIYMYMYIYTYICMYIIFIYIIYKIFHEHSRFRGQQEKEEGIFKLLSTTSTRFTKAYTLLAISKDCLLLQKHGNMEMN